MKISKLYLIGSLLAILSSCGDNKEIIQSEVEFATVANSNFSKDDLIKLVEPFENGSIKGKIFVSYPLYLTRLDLENSKSKLDYEANKGVNYEKIAAIKRDFEKYFTETFTDSLLNVPASKAFSIDDYVSMPNVFLFSNEAVGNKSMGGKKIYSDISELRTDLSNFVLKNKSKTIILYNAIPKQKSLKELATSNDSAKHNQDELIHIKSDVIEYSEQNKRDYRPLYILAKNAVYMNKDHHESFKFINKAVEIAHENGQMDMLVQDIGHDMESHNEAIQKMSQGHPHDWNPIMSAILNDDISKLRHHDE